MNAVEIIRSAEHDLEHGKINLGEYAKRIEPLKDVECVVRCKDCKHGYRCRNAAGDDCVECSNHYVSLESICREPDWYCADGERKDGGSE